MKMRNTNNNQDIEGGNSDTMFVVDDDIDDVDGVDDDVDDDGDNNVGSLDL